jgi:hypothetical protein
MRARIDKASAPANVAAADAPGRFTPYCRREARPLQLGGEILAETHSFRESPPMTAWRSTEPGMGNSSPSVG